MVFAYHYTSGFFATGMIFYLVFWNILKKYSKSVLVPNYYYMIRKDATLRQRVAISWDDVEPWYRYQQYKTMDVLPFLANTQSKCEWPTWKWDSCLLLWLTNAHNELISWERELVLYSRGERAVVLLGTRRWQNDIRCLWKHSSSILEMNPSGDDRAMAEKSNFL